MKRISSILTVVALLTGFVFAADKPFVYPQPAKTEQSDDYHGTKVADPYRELENTDSEAVSSLDRQTGATTIPWNASDFASRVKSETI